MSQSSLIHCFFRLRICYVQIVRSVSQWSAGTSQTEESIHNAYCSLIEAAEHFVYIEVQALRLCCHFVVHTIWVLHFTSCNDHFCHLLFLSLAESIFHIGSKGGRDHPESRPRVTLQAYPTSAQRREVLPSYCCHTSPARLSGTWLEFIIISTPSLLANCLNKFHFSLNIKGRRGWWWRCNCSSIDALAVPNDKLGKNINTV